MSDPSLWRHPIDDLPIIDQLVQVHVIAYDLSRQVHVGWWDGNKWSILDFYGLIEKEGQESYTVRIPRYESIVLGWCHLNPPPLHVTL